MADEVRQDSPELIETLRALLTERGFVLVRHDLAQGVYAAEAIGVTPTVEVASSSAAGLVVAVGAHWKRQLDTSPDWGPTGPQILHDVVDEEQLADLIPHEDEEEDV